MLRVGLTGGLATGKSFVGETLEGLGCHLLKADELGHELLLPGGKAYQPVVDAFGSCILDEKGVIVRRKLAAEVFDNPERLKLLTSLVHPPVVAREEEWMRQISEFEPDAIAVVEAAILVETGSYRRFSRLIVTVCQPEQQIERAMKRGGISREEVESRLRRQMSLEEKIKVADYVVDTSGDKKETVRQVHEVYQALRSDRQ